MNFVFFVSLTMQLPSQHAPTFCVTFSTFNGEHDGATDREWFKSRLLFHIDHELEICDFVINGDLHYDVSTAHYLRKILGPSAFNKMVALCPSFRHASAHEKFVLKWNPQDPKETPWDLFRTNNAWITPKDKATLLHLQTMHEENKMLDRKNAFVSIPRDLIWMNTLESCVPLKDFVRSL